MPEETQTTVPDGGSQTTQVESSQPNKDANEQPTKVEVGSGNADAHLPAGLKTELFKLRQERRENRARMDALQAELNTLKSNPARGETTGQEPSGLLDNPEKFVQARVEAEISRREAERAKVDAERQFREDAANAEKWLLSQEYLKDDPDGPEEIDRIITGDKELQRVVSASPKVAAELAYKKWLEAKGIGNVGAKTSQGRATLPKPAAGSGSVGKKVWMKDELIAYANSLDPHAPDFGTKFQEVILAQREGRIK